MVIGTFFGKQPLYAKTGVFFLLAVDCDLSWDSARDGVIGLHHLGEKGNTFGSTLRSKSSSCPILTMIFSSFSMVFRFWVARPPGWSAGSFLDSAVALGIFWRCWVLMYRLSSGPEALW